MVREICEILTTVADANGSPTQRVTGRFLLEGRKLTYDGEARFGQMLMDTPGWVDTEGDGELQRVTARANPALWFHVLPRTFTGSYLTAKIVT